jgi:hypothetical protein
MIKRSRSDFSPSGLLRNPHLQSMLASSGLRRWWFRARHEELEKVSTEHILDCGDGVRLQGYFSPPPDGAYPRGLVVLLHGWEGSAQSSYIRNVGWRLRRAGLAVFRLNFRDHGESHHLNQEVFHSCRLEEVIGAVDAIAKLFPQRPLALAGFSLGGNFALRVGLNAPARGIPVERIVAICPAIRPHNVLTAIEDAPWFYNAYFMLKWRESLRKKAELFPQQNRFDEATLKRDMRGLTEELVERHTDYASLNDYLDGYSVHGDRLSRMAVETHILAAMDDPIIPISDFDTLRLSPTTLLDVVEHGGHCGFIADWSLESWAETYLLERLTA